jgi:hypothetical protein
MIATKATTRFDAKRVKKAMDAANFRNLGHAGGYLRKAARHSIRKSPKPSPAGTPPHTRKGRIRNAIKCAVVKATQSVVIGPDVDVAGTSGAAHEFGGPYRHETYDRRAFMGPALERHKDRLPDLWANSVKGA